MTIGLSISGFGLQNVHLNTTITKIETSLRIAEQNNDRINGIESFKL